MKTETSIQEKVIEYIGAGYRFRIQKGFKVLVLMTAKSFFVPIADIETEVAVVPSPVISFDEFAARYQDHEGGFITCVQFAGNGSPEEKRLAVWDFIHECYYENDEPYFTDDQKAEYRSDIEETLLNIIESKY